MICWSRNVASNCHGLIWHFYTVMTILANVWQVKFFTTDKIMSAPKKVKCNNKNINSPHCLCYSFLCRYFSSEAQQFVHCITWSRKRRTIFVTFMLNLPYLDMPQNIVLTWYYITMAFLGMSHVQDHTRRRHIWIHAHMYACMQVHTCLHAHMAASMHACTYEHRYVCSTYPQD